MHLNSEPFKQIKEGLKDTEARLFDSKRQEIKVGDKITFILRADETQTITKKIVGLSIFDSFINLFQFISPVRCGFEKGSSPQESATQMMKYYSEKEEKELGVVGIHLS